MPKLVATGLTQYEVEHVIALPRVIREKSTHGRTESLQQTTPDTQPTTPSTATFWRLYWGIAACISGGVFAMGLSTTKSGVWQSFEPSVLPDDDKEQAECKVLVRRATCLASDAHCSWFGFDEGCGKTRCGGARCASD
jgi:hypothetical protein